MATDQSTIEATAAEFVLGTLRGSDRDIFEARLREDIELQQMVARWERILTPLVAAVPSTDPPIAVWQRIGDSLGFPGDETGRLGQADEIADIQSPAYGRSLPPRSGPPESRESKKLDERTTKPVYGASIGERVPPRTGVHAGSTERREDTANAGYQIDSGNMKRSLAFILRKAGPEESWSHPNSGAPDMESKIKALERRAGRWRVAAIVAGGLACLLTLVIVFMDAEPQSPSMTILTAVLGPVDASPIWMIRYGEEQGRLQVDAIQPGPELEDQTYELWALMPNSAPLSLGPLPAGHQTRLSLPEGTSQRLGGGIPLAVTIEPDEGSPTGQPTGPILHTGRLESMAPNTQ